MRVFRELHKVADGGIDKKAAQLVGTMEDEDKKFSMRTLAEAFLSLNMPTPATTVADISWRPVPDEEFSKLSDLGAFNDSLHRPVIAVDVDIKHNNSHISDQISDWLLSKSERTTKSSYWPYGFNNNNFNCHFISAFQLMAALIMEFDLNYRNCFYPLVEATLRMYIREHKRLEEDTLLFIAEVLFDKETYREQQDAADDLCRYFLSDQSLPNRSWDTTRSLTTACSKCSSTSTCNELHPMLLLNFPTNNKKVSIQDMLDHHMRTDNNEEKKLLTCSSCESSSSVTQKYTYVSFPKTILILNIMRFSFSPTSKKTIKSMRKVQLSETIRVDCNGAQYIYDLVGVIVHYGELGGMIFIAHA